MDHPQCVRVLVEGRVQGVWYRGWTAQTAQALGLSGWVRNLSDGRVEAVFLGPPAAIQAMIDACRQGPPAARVTAVTAEPWSEHPGHGFHQRPTA
ncbi:MAG: acylphosphatase [Magnetospirillum sp.]|nr:acylphosphatase [Magnetospirillum sp.]